MGSTVTLGPSFTYSRAVKPEATPDEVNAVVNDTSGGGDQIFAQAVCGKHLLLWDTTHTVLQLSNSTRYAESRQAYREVQERHGDIQRIERTLEELATLFSDVSFALAHLLCIAHSLYR